MPNVQAPSTRRKTDKIWRDALIRALARIAPDGTGVTGGLDMVATAVVTSAMTGDIQAMKEIGDRLDGKPKQSTEVSGPDGEAIPVGLKVSFVDGSGNSGT